jgi:RNA polymerase sigma-70 factor (ECF subfamily)
MRAEQEQEYILQAQKRPRAFARLYDFYFPRVYAYVSYRVSSPQDAEDLVADLFFKAIRDLRRFEWRGGGSFAAWLFRIAHNLIVDHYRRTERHGLPSSDTLVDLASPMPGPEESLTQQQTFQQIRGLIATLSLRRQEVITLKFFGGLRNHEIADILGLDARTVASHLSRGLRDLEHKYPAPRQSEPVIQTTMETPT